MVASPRALITVRPAGSGFFSLQGFEGRVGSGVEAVLMFALPHVGASRCHSLDGSM